ncbi:MAG: polyprenyl synthetase family protein [Clostridia bacterium]|nr:polyprenyl synthetase family protein [Clostridia bacterium]
MQFKNAFNEKKRMFDKYLDEYLPSGKENIGVIEDAMRYSVLSGGKRLRPILMASTYELFRDDIQGIIPLACSIEYIHCYSLIHDDLPAMDNDDYRRGKLTNHKVFGEAMAILAGDALLTHAFETMLSCINFDSAATYIRAIREITASAGLDGMLGGQVADVIYEGKNISSDVLRYIHTHKTGALIRASVITGAIMGNAEHEQRMALEKYAHNIGLAFQIKDDLLDIIGDENIMGKKTGSDAKKNKSTYPSLFGIDESKKVLDSLTSEAVDSLKIFGESAEFLQQLAIYIGKRDR